MKTFCGSYFYRNKWWGFTIEAEDWDDAKARLEQMWTGIIVGELISTEPFSLEALH
jgi:hypothetical protein